MLPPFELKLPGFGVLNYVIDVNHIRLLSLLVLVPTLFAMGPVERGHRFGRNVVDLMLIGYAGLTLVLQGAVDSPTNTARKGRPRCFRMLQA